MKPEIEIISCILYDKHEGTKNNNGITLLPLEYVTYHAKVKVNGIEFGVSYNIFKTTFYPLGEERSLEIAKECIIKYIEKDLLEKKVGE